MQALYNLLHKFREKGTVEDLPRRRRARKIKEEMRKLIEEDLNKNDELNLLLLVSELLIHKRLCDKVWCTAPQLCKRLRSIRFAFNVENTQIHCSTVVCTTVLECFM